MAVLHRFYCLILVLVFLYFHTLGLQAEKAKTRLCMYAGSSEFSLVAYAISMNNFKCLKFFLFYISVMKKYNTVFRVEGDLMIWANP